MVDKKGKRAVIINNIKSKSIEQAIFILKPRKTEECIDPGEYVISEAQEIINSYIRRLEGTVPEVHKKSGKIMAAGVVLLTLIGFIAAYFVIKS